MNYIAKIVKGHGRGKLLGFPTYNLKIPADLEVSYGIYAGLVWIEGTMYPGAFHYGPVPTFQQTTPTLEVFVLDYAPIEDPQEITFSLVKLLREIQHFSTAKDLEKQIAADVALVRQYAQEFAA